MSFPILALDFDGVSNAFAWFFFYVPLDFRSASFSFDIEKWRIHLIGVEKKQKRNDETSREEEREGRKWDEINVAISLSTSGWLIVRIRRDWAAFVHFDLFRVRCDINCNHFLCNRLSTSNWKWILASNRTKCAIRW